MSRLQLLIDQLWDFNDPAASESRFRDAMSKAVDDSQRLELQTQLARALGLQRKFEGAHETLDEVRTALDAGGESLAAANVRYLLERGRVFNSSNHPDQARLLFEQAFDAARTISDDHLAIDAAHMIAIVSSPNDAMLWNIRALELAKKSAQPRARQWIASLHNNIAWTLHDQDEYEKALSHFQMALEHRRSQDKPRETQIAQWCVARALRSLGRVEEALAMQQSLLNEVQQTNQMQDGFISEEIGECLLALDRADEARPHFDKAHQLLSQDTWLAERQPQRLQRLAQLADQPVSD